MEIILIILTSTLLSVFFFAIYQYGLTKGIKQGKEIQKREDSLNNIDISNIDDEVVNQIVKQYNFIKYGKGD